jgi:hypothetical protein
LIYKSSLPYLYTNLSRFFSPSFVPTHRDILHLHERTIGTTETTLIVNGIDTLVVDVRDIGVSLQFKSQLCSRSAAQFLSAGNGSTPSPISQSSYTPSALLGIAAFSSKIHAGYVRFTSCPVLTILPPT